MAVRWLVALGAATFSSLVGHLPPFRTNKIARHKAMLNSSMESLLHKRGSLRGTPERASSPAVCFISPGGTTRHREARRPGPD